ncbi:MAG: hypothetical protein GF313_02215 [Caldithrix sp.]|nr:hypothetical protein [Caldithrix sp.]
MAYIAYRSEREVPEENQVADHDNILRISRIHSKFMRQHYEMFIELMKKRSPLSRAQREMIAVVVSAVNTCHY